MENGSVAVHRARPGLFPDLNLFQNLVFEHSLAGDSSIDEATLREVGRLFQRCGCHFDLLTFKTTWPADASSDQLLMVWLGRSILSAPEHLVIEESDWPNVCGVTVQQFKDAYQWSYPWRRLTMYPVNHAESMGANL